MYVDLSRKVTCCPSLKQIFYCNAFFNCVPEKLKTPDPVVLCYALQHLQSVRAQSKALSKNFPRTWLWCVQLPARLTCWLPRISLVRLPNAINFPHSCSVRLYSSPYRCNLSPHIFHNAFWSNWLFQDSLRTFFWILAEHLPQILLRGTPAHRMFFSVESPSYVFAVF